MTLTYTESYVGTSSEPRPLISAEPDEGAEYSLRKAHYFCAKQMDEAMMYAYAIGAIQQAMTITQINGKEEKTL